MEERTPILEEGAPVLAEDGMDSSLVGGDSSADATLMFTDDEFDDDDEVEFYDENDKISAWIRNMKNKPCPLRKSSKRN